MSGFVLAGDETFIIAGIQVGDEPTARLQHAMNLPHQLLEFKHMIEAVRVDAVNGISRESKRMEVAGHDISIPLAGIEIDPDREMPERYERLHLVTESRGQAQYRRMWRQLDEQFETLAKAGNARIVLVHQYVLEL